MSATNGVSMDDLRLLREQVTRVEQILHEIQASLAAPEPAPPLPPALLSRSVEASHDLHKRCLAQMLKTRQRRCERKARLGVKMSDIDVDPMIIAAYRNSVIRLGLPPDPCFEPTDEISDPEAYTELNNPKPSMFSALRELFPFF